MYGKDKHKERRDGNFRRGVEILRKKSNANSKTKHKQYPKYCIAEFQ